MPLMIFAQKKWRLPTNSEQSGLINYKDAYNPVAGGYYYYNGSLENTGYSFWWSATVYDSNGRYRLDYSGSSLATYYDYYLYRGFYVRCIHT